MKILAKFIALFVLLFILSCESNFKKIQKNNFHEFVPNGEADRIHLRYTDSGKISAVLVSSKMLDYSGVAFPFVEFPKGILVTLYDKKGSTTTVKSNYAVSYKKTNIIDLQGKVEILSQEGQKLETEQLYFDQKNDWFYTEKKFKFTDPKGVSFGQGIDFSKDFKIIKSHRVTGEITSSIE